MPSTKSYYKSRKGKRKPWTPRRYWKYHARSSLGRLTSTKGAVIVRVPVQRTVFCQVKDLARSVVDTGTPTYGTYPIIVNPWCDDRGTLTAGTTYPINVGATHSPLFRAYAALFDRVKCNSVKATMSMASDSLKSTEEGVYVPIASTGGTEVAYTQGYNLSTASDRSGTFTEVTMTASGKDGRMNNVDITYQPNFRTRFFATYVGTENRIDNHLKAEGVQELTTYYNTSIDQTSNVATLHSWSALPMTNTGFSPSIYFQVRPLLNKSGLTTSDTYYAVRVSAIFEFTFKSPRFTVFSAGTGLEPEADQPVD